MDFFNKFPEFDCQNFKLRQIDSDRDFSNFFDYISDPKVSRFVASEDLPRNLSEAKIELDYWQKLFTLKRGFFWAIAELSSNDIIGMAGFNYLSFNHRRAEISYDLSAKHWNKSIMTNALKIICQFAFDILKIQRIQANVATDNHSSIRVLEKLGFQKEGLMRNYAILHGNQKDFYIYSKINMLN